MKHNLCMLFFMNSLFATPGKSFLSLRPSFEAGSTERFVLDRLLQKQMYEGNHFFNLVPIFNATTKPKDLGSYFLPTTCNCMTIAEDNADITRDINANYLGIISVPLANKTGTEVLNLIEEMTYASTLSLCPKRKEYGLGILYRYHIPETCWFDISTIASQIKQNLKACESISNTGGTGPNGIGSPNLATSMCNSTSFNYGKITSQELTKSGISQVELRVGKTSINEARALSGFLGVDIPTGEKPCQKYLFEPVMGNNKHVGLFFGIEGTQNLITHNDTTFNLSCDMLLRYLFSNNQLRSFDLKNRPWSRYLIIWNSSDALSNPASATNATNAFDQTDYLINYSTLWATVSPKFQFDAQCALDFNKSDWHLELGYHFFAKQKEKLCIAGCLDKDLGISAFAHYLRRWSVDDNTPVTRSFNTIDGDTFAAQPDVVDYTYDTTEGTFSTPYNEITVCDLDPDSAATPAQMIHTIYGSVGYTCNYTFPFILNLAASYDMSANNHAPHKWNIWFQLGINF
jgi:hypothetical protein